MDVPRGRVTRAVHYRTASESVPSPGALTRTHDPAGIAARPQRLRHRTERWPRRSPARSVWLPMRGTGEREKRRPIRRRHHRFPVRRDSCAERRDTCDQQRLRASAGYRDEWPDRPWQQHLIVRRGPPAASRAREASRSSASSSAASLQSERASMVLPTTAARPGCAAAASVRPSALPGPCKVVGSAKCGTAPSVRCVTLRASGIGATRCTVRMSCEVRAAPCTMAPAARRSMSS